MLYKSFRLLFLFGVLLFAISAQAPSDTVADTATTAVDSLKKDGAVIMKFSLREDIEPFSWRMTQKAFEQAREINADAMLIDMNTYGGLVYVADSIRSKLLRSQIPVYVWINDNAASAGAFIAIACHRIYMTEGSSIGAATVVDQSGEVVPDKYQSYMRSRMRSTAEARGRDPQIAQGMVDPDVEVPGVSEKGKVITFTRKEALEHGFCDGKAATPDEVLRQEGFTNYTIQELELRWTDKVISLLTSPFISGILIMIIIGGIYFELQTPGIGFPIIAAGIAALLYFLPLFLEDLAASWEILLFVIGVVLLGLELFVIPGFGVAGISGIILILTGLILSLVPNVNFDFGWVETGRIVQAILTVVVSFILSIGLIVVFGKSVMRSSPFQSLVLNSTLSTAEAYKNLIVQKESLVGKTGVVVSDLRPGGKVEIDDEYYDVVTEGGFTPRGAIVKVVQDYRTRIVVREITDQKSNTET
ncbi:MAG: NfeD family protein [Bacteroidia bacterium]